MAVRVGQVTSRYLKMGPALERARRVVPEPGQPAAVRRSSAKAVLRAHPVGSLLAAVPQVRPDDHPREAAHPAHPDDHRRAAAARGASEAGEARGLSTAAVAEAQEWLADCPDSPEVRGCN